MADVDLSHLTEEERRLIEEVLQRQKNEEEKDMAVVHNLASEVKQIEQRVIQQQSATLGGLINDPDKQGLCQICQKVKSADGIGHRCYKCNIHTCPRCGGRVPIHNSNKMQWLCALCKKKQELAKKSAAWYHGSVGQLLASESVTPTAQSAPIATARPGLNGPLSSTQPLQNGRLPASSSSAAHPPGGPHAPLRRQASHDPRTDYQQEKSSGQQMRQQSLRRHGTVDQPSYQMSFRDQEQLNQQAPTRRRDPSVSNRRDTSKTRVPPEYPTRRPESQNDVRKKGYPESGEPYPSRSRRTQSQDRYNQEEYAADYDPRRGAYEQWEDPRRRAEAPYGTREARPNYSPASAEDRRRKYQQNSFSSSEDELRSNWSEYSLNDNGSIHSYRSEASTRTHPGLRHMTRTNRGRLGRMQSEQEPEYYSLGYGADSRSLNVSWRPSKNGRHLIGHMILRKNFSDVVSRTRNSAKMLGIQVDGGQMSPSGRLTAVITRLKPGSVAHVVGNLKVGDTILEWNRIPLTDHTYEEVCNILNEAPDDPEVELMVSRKVQERFSQQPESFGSASRLPRRFSPRPPLHRSFEAPPSVSGRIQLSFYYSHQHMHLAVTILRGAELIPRRDQGLRNPYVVMYLLPDRNEQSRRRSKCCSKTNDPQWNETFYFYHVKESELDDLTLEVTVWDYDRYKQTNSEFLGEALIQLANLQFNDEPAWFFLSYPDTEIEKRQMAGFGYGEGDFDGLSPAGSSASRMSDMDYVSDPDLLEGMDRRRRHYPSPGGAPGYASARSAPQYLSSDDSPRYLDRERVERDMFQNRVGVGTERRGRREQPSGPDEVVRQGRNNRRSHHSAPPVGEDPYEYEDFEGSPPVSRPSSSMASSSHNRSKRQLPTLPSSNLNVIPSASRRSSFTLTGDNDQSNMPHSPHSHRDPSFSKQPIMQVHNSTLKIPHAEEISHHPPKLDQLLNNTSQEENIDPRDRIAQQNSGQNLEVRAGSFRHSRSSSRRSQRGQTSSLSRSSEPTPNELSVLTQSESQRRLSESLPRMESMDVDETGSQINAAIKSPNNKDKKKFDYDAFQTQMMLNQQNKKNVSSKAAAILGLKKDTKKPTFTRSEEVGHQSPATVRAAMVKQMSKDSTDGSVSSGGGRSHRHNHLTKDSHLASFIAPLGPGQIVGRQVLASPCLGQLQLHIKYEKAKLKLEVEVVRGRGFVPKTSARGLPATYVKVVLMEDKRIIAKAKTTVVRRSLDPLYQQQIVFNETAERRHLHTTVWGDYGRMDKKTFMGLAIIALDDLDLSTVVVGWYTLFNSDTQITPGKSSSYVPGAPFEERQTSRSGIVDA